MTSAIDPGSWSRDRGSRPLDDRQLCSLRMAMAIAVAFQLVMLAVGPCVVAASAQSTRSGGDGTLYMANYSGTIYVIDESTMQIEREIPTTGQIPTGLLLSHNRERLYVLDASSERVEVIDIETGESLDTFRLTDRDGRVRFSGIQIDPRERFAVMIIKRYVALDDRYRIEGPTIVRYDLESHQVTDTIPWPDDEEREGVRMMFSPDGELLYMFTDDIIALETEGFTEVDRWELSEPLEPGLGRFSFGFPTSLYEEPGVFTGLFRITDPVQNRRMMGVARVRLEDRDVEFYTLGPSEGVSFSLAPDHRKAYGLKSEIGHYEFWTFDLEARRVAQRVPFAGRPRMSLVPSTNGELLYILNAGNTVDIYDAETFEHLRQVAYDADMIGWLLVPQASGGS
jgi:hypothetical protein